MKVPKECYGASSWGKSRRPRPFSTVGNFWEKNEIFEYYSIMTCGYPIPMFLRRGIDSTHYLSLRTSFDPIRATPTFFLANVREILIMETGHVGTLSLCLLGWQIDYKHYLRPPGLLWPNFGHTHLQLGQFNKDKFWFRKLGMCVLYLVSMFLGWKVECKHYISPWTFFDPILATPTSSLANFRGSGSGNSACGYPTLMFLGRKFECKHNLSRTDHF